MHPLISWHTSRRSFLRTLGLSLGGSLSLGTALWTQKRRRSRPLRLALVGDSHLMADGRNDAFAHQLRAVLGQIARHVPRLDAVLFTGNLAHMGRHEAQRIGHTLLSQIDLPLVVGAGAHDWHRDGGAQYRALFGEANTLTRLGPSDVFVLKLFGAHVTQFSGGAHQSVQGRMQALATPDDARPARFSLSDEAIEFAYDAIERLPAQSELVVLTHPPLYDYFAPWNFVTENAHRLAQPLARIKRVIFVHGQAQHPVAFYDASVARLHVGAPSTAWAWPYPRPHTALFKRSAETLAGCGYAVLTLGAAATDPVGVDYHLGDNSPARTLSLSYPHVGMT